METRAPDAVAAWLTEGGRRWEPCRIFVLTCRMSWAAGGCCVIHECECAPESEAAEDTAGKPCHDLAKRSREVCLSRRGGTVLKGPVRRLLRRRASRQHDEKLISPDGTGSGCLPSRTAPPGASGSIGVFGRSIYQVAGGALRRVTWPRVPTHTHTKTWTPTSTADQWMPGPWPFRHEPSTVREPGWKRAGPARPRSLHLGISGVWTRGGAVVCRRREGRAGAGERAGRGGANGSSWRAVGAGGGRVVRRGGGGWDERSMGRREWGRWQRGAGGRDGWRGAGGTRRARRVRGDGGVAPGRSWGGGVARPIDGWARETAKVRSGKPGPRQPPTRVFGSTNV